LPIAEPTNVQEATVAICIWDSPVRCQCGKCAGRLLSLLRRKRLGKRPIVLPEQPFTESSAVIVRHNGLRGVLKVPKTATLRRFLKQFASARRSNKLMIPQLLQRHLLQFDRKENE
jgi:hypothetical protein